MGIQEAGGKAECLRGEKGHFEIDNLLLLFGCGPGAISLSMARGGVDGLMGQIEEKIVLVVGRIDIGDFLGSRERRGFAAVKHDGAQETEIGGRQRATILGDRIHFVAAVFVVYVDDLIVRVCGDGESNPNQTPRSKQTVGSSSSRE